MNKEAGIILAAVPMDIIVIGKVDKLLSSAKLRPTVQTRS